MNIHFPTSIYNSSNILCENCTENQQKLIQVLNSFDFSSNVNPKINHQLQYSLYSKKLESRYPLCATCSYRVSVHLKKCEDEAMIQERRGINVVSGSGGDWKNKIKLAQRMKWKQFKRKIEKIFFFWPDFFFQLILTVTCILGSQVSIITNTNDDIKCVWW